MLKTYSCLKLRQYVILKIETVFYTHTPTHTHTYHLHKALACSECSINISFFLFFKHKNKSANTNISAVSCFCLGWQSHGWGPLHVDSYWPYLSLGSYSLTRTSISIGFSFRNCKNISGKNISGAENFHWFLSYQNLIIYREKDTISC